ncbi:MAG: hypothetical protein VCC04_00980 [Myxococcota bacterium]
MRDTDFQLKSNISFLAFRIPPEKDPIKNIAEAGFALNPFTALDEEQRLVETL